jgi:hypothetical protein
MARLVGSWMVSFSTGPDPDLGGHSFFDGKMQLWSSNWLVLLDHSGDPIVGCRVSDTSFQIRSSIHIQNYLVRIMKPATVLVPAISSTVEDPAFSTVVKDISRDRCKSWKITYSTYKDLDRGRMKSYDGFLELRKKDNFLILSNAKGNQIACRFQKPKESFHMGARLYFPLHVVRMGVSIDSIPQKCGHVESSTQEFSALKDTTSSDHVMSSISV